MLLRGLGGEQLHDVHLRLLPLEEWAAVLPIRDRVQGGLGRRPVQFPVLRSGGFHGLVGHPG